MSAPAAAPGPSVRSEAQREASRRNGSRSKGPRTPAGQFVASRNALKHGLAGSGRHLPPDLDADLGQHREALSESYRPRNARERILLEQAALGSARLGQLLVNELRRASARTRDALKAWDERRAAEVAELAAALTPRPAETLPRLRATCEGCDWLADAWLVLAAALEDRGTLDPDEVRRGLRLLGVHPDHARFEPIAAEFRALVQGTRDPDPEASAEARAELAALLDEAVAELAERGRHLWETHDRPDREDAPGLAYFDPSPEGRLLARYVADSERLQRRAIAELHRMRREEARPAPARNEPEPAPAESSDLSSSQEFAVNRSAADLASETRTGPPFEPSEASSERAAVTPRPLAPVSGEVPGSGDGPTPVIPRPGPVEIAPGPGSSADRR